MPATHRTVLTPDGFVDVALEPAEAAAIEAEWEANAPGTGSAWQAEQAARVQQLRTAAKAVVAESDGDTAALPKALRALALVILDELNLHAAKLNAILTAIDSGSTLAQVKANIAAIADYPTRTAAQIKTAVRGKLDSGDADA